MTTELLDVRPLRKPDKHPTIFGVYDGLGLASRSSWSTTTTPSTCTTSSRSSMQAASTGSTSSAARESGGSRSRSWPPSPLPRVLCNTVTAAKADSGECGAAWKLQMRRRDLDSNIIHCLPRAPSRCTPAPSLDVLIHVLDGAGELTTELDTLTLETGDLIWLPRRSRRQFTAGPDGLRYLTVHQRRQALTLTATQHL